MNETKQIIKITKYSIIALLLFNIVNFSSCDGDCYRNFGIHTTNKVMIDRVELTRDTLYTSETQGVKLWGTIGTNSGYKFNGLEVIRNTYSVDITAWNSLDIPCGTKTTDTLLVLSGYVYNINPPQTQGSNSVNIHQPDGSVTTRTYFVRQ